MRQRAVRHSRQFARTAPGSAIRALEKSAWKAFRTDFYPTYDYYPVVREKLANKARLVL